MRNLRVDLAFTNPEHSTKLVPKYLTQRVVRRGYPSTSCPKSATISKIIILRKTQISAVYMSTVNRTGKRGDKIK